MADHGGNTCFLTRSRATSETLVAANMRFPSRYSKYRARGELRHSSAQCSIRQCSIRPQRFRHNGTPSDAQARPLRGTDTQGTDVRLAPP